MTNSNDTTVNRPRDLLPAQYLNQLRHRVFLIMSYITEYSTDMRLKTTQNEIRWVHIVMACTAHANSGTCFVQVALREPLNIVNNAPCSFVCSIK